MGSVFGHACPNHAFYSLHPFKFTSKPTMGIAFRTLARTLAKRTLARKLVARVKEKLAPMRLAGADKRLFVRWHRAEKNVCPLPAISFDWGSRQTSYRMQFVYRTVYSQAVLNALAYMATWLIIACIFDDIHNMMAFLVASMVRGSEQDCYFSCLRISTIKVIGITLIVVASCRFCVLIHYNL